MNSKELIKIIEMDGWFFCTQKGSHKIYRHPTKKGIVVVPEHGKKDCTKGLSNGILKHAGIKLRNKHL